MSTAGAVMNRIHTRRIPPEGNECAQSPRSVSRQPTCLGSVKGISPFRVVQRVVCSEGHIQIAPSAQGTRSRTDLEAGAPQQSVLVISESGDAEIERVQREFVRSVEVRSVT